ncbi:lysine exporter LysO family protein [Marinilabilia rubra]|uniref:Lysine exporter LysO family protein n=1 Tax=Marinilabilia rubra TaxID=2162893 RepID=A0A2U2B6B0_9BACT|nr:lysine exporter LysO family protein [Marinilabilia rubra]PWD98573.1 hypothetical protein DDZ16_15155 [Marinilabilia rubra]
MVSLTVIGLFVVGIGIGIIFRKSEFFLKVTEKLVAIAVFALLFFLGVSVGSDPRIVNNISILGWQAVLLSSGAIIGSLLLARLMASFFRKKEVSANKQERTNTTIGSRLMQMLRNQSLWILLFFAAGIILSVYEITPRFLGHEDVSTATLYTMMIFVGSGIGSDPRALDILKQTSFHILIVPVIVIVGSIGGSLIIAQFLDNVNSANGMAVGAGFGYYSLSAIIIGKISGGEMGVIALLSNIFREVFTLVAAPLVVKWFGQLGAIVSGGATAMDTTLPVIIKATGKEYAVISIFSGIILSVLVPVLVPLLLGN